MTLGKNLIVSIDGTPIAGAKSCKFQISQNFINVCSPTASRVLNKKPTTYDWSMSVDCLIPNSAIPEVLTDVLIEGTRVLLTFTDGSGYNRAGFAYVKSCEESGSVGSLAKFSASFEADGALYKYIQYNATNFSEGNNVRMSLSGDAISFTFNSPTHSKLQGIEIHNTKNGKLYILNTMFLWAIYNKTFSDIKSSLIEQQSPSSTSLFAKGQDIAIVDLSANEYYTFLSNNYSPTLIFMYE